VVSIQVESPRSLRDVAEVRLGLAAGGLFATTAALVALRVPTAAAVTALLVQTGLSCLVLERRSAALLVGVSGWALSTGFAVNRLGVLTFSAPDLARLAAFAACAQAALAVHDTMSAVRTARRRRDGWTHAQPPATRLGVRRRDPGAVADGAGAGPVA